MPFVAQQVEDLRAQLRRWSDPDLVPCALPSVHPPATLVFFFNAFPNATLESELRAEMERMPRSVRACFDDTAELLYARLDGAEDRYPTGPNRQFQQLFVHPHASLRHMDFTHFMLMEPDMQPIRPYWLDSLQALMRQTSVPLAGERTAETETETETATAAAAADAGDVAQRTPMDSPVPSFAPPLLVPACTAAPPSMFGRMEWWQQGSLLHAPSSVDESIHMNGNALYALSSAFILLLQSAWTKLPSHAFDLALYYYMWGTPSEWKQCRPDNDRSDRQRETSMHWHKFRYTPLLYNCGEEGCPSHHLLLLDQPRTVLAHKMDGRRHGGRSANRLWPILVRGTLIVLAGGATTAALMNWRKRRRAAEQAATETEAEARTENAPLRGEREQEQGDEERR